LLDCGQDNKSVAKKQQIFKNSDWPLHGREKLVNSH